MSMYYVYTLKSLKDKKLYIGHTNNLRKRLLEHNRGSTESTRLRKPLELIHYEAFLNIEDALAKEKFLKTGWGRNYIKRNLKNYFKEKNN